MVWHEKHQVQAGELGAGQQDAKRQLRAQQTSKSVLWVWGRGSKKRAVAVIPNTYVNDFVQQNNWYFRI